MKRKDLIAAVVAFNDSEFNPEVEYSELSEDEIKNNFMTAVEAILDTEDKEKIKKIPDAVALAYNALVDEIDAANKTKEEEKNKEAQEKKGGKKSETAAEKTKTKGDDKTVSKNESKNVETKNTKKTLTKTQEVANLLEKGKDLDFISKFLTDKYGEKTGNKRNVLTYIANIKKASSKK